MPTKHKRKRADIESKDYDLPPSVKAKSLPVIAPTKTFLEPARKRSKPNISTKKPRTNVDDTPKQFARLMAWHKEGKKLRTGLDTGIKSEKPKKKSSSKKTAEAPPDSTETASKTPQAAEVTMDSDTQPNSTINTETSQPAPKIKPGESLRDFAARVDQALPLSTVSKHNTKSIPGVNVKAPLTKHNKRLARMQADWRATETRLKTAREEAVDEEYERHEEEHQLWDGVRAEKAKRKGKKRKGATAIDDNDPWAKLEKQRRAETKQKDIRDVVQAPPVLQPLKGIFKQDRQPNSQIVAV